MDYETEEKARTIANDLQHQYQNDRRIKIICSGKKLEISAHFEETIDEALTSLDSLLANIKLMEEVE